MHHAFLYISLPFLHDYDVKMPNCNSFMEDVNKRRRISFSLSKVECSSQEINAREIRLHLPFSANWNKRDSVWKTGIHFKSDVFTAVTVVDAKAPFLSRGGHFVSEELKSFVYARLSFVLDYNYVTKEEYACFSEFGTGNQWWQPLFPQ